MNGVTLNATANYNSNRLGALRMYLKQSDGEFQATLDSAMSDAVDALYKKSVPAPVQSYISLLNGETKPEKKAKVKKPKPARQDMSVPEAATEALPDEYGAYN